MYANAVSRDLGVHEHWREQTTLLTMKSVQPAPSPTMPLAAATPKPCLGMKQDHWVTVRRAAGHRAGHARINLLLCNKQGL
jgi:hypothetical protein